MAGADRKLRIERSCPLPSAHTRLHQAHELWHRTAEAYPDPDEFILQLNSLLVTMRQVTFMLQSEKRRIPGFEPWYEVWRERMRKDALMRWLHDARTTVEKQGDLDLVSTARVRLIVDWVDGPELDLEVPPLLGPEEIASRILEMDLPERLKTEGFTEVERRWVSKDLRHHELTDVCAHGYGVMATILAEAHERCGITMRTFGGETHAGRHDRVEHLGGRLPCMVMSREDRTARLHLASGELFEIIEREVDFDPATQRDRFEEQMEKLTIGPDALKYEVGEDPLDLGDRWMSIARRVFAYQGFHEPQAILLDQLGHPITIIRLAYRDQADKHLTYRHLAGQVDRLGAYTVVLFGEVWQARVPISHLKQDTGVRATDRPDRTEALVVTVATADGRHRTWLSPITRTSKGEPVLGAGTVEEAGVHLAPFLFPLQKVWRRWRESD